MSAKVSAKMSALSEADRALVEAASDAIRKRYRYDWQEVGAALRTRSGKVFTGVSLDAYLGRMAICAEAVALGQAIAIAGETGIEMIVAVRHPPPEEKDRPIAVVSPNGRWAIFTSNWEKTLGSAVDTDIQPGGRYRSDVFLVALQ